MYLTKIDLQPQVRAIQRAIADCQQMHRLVNGLFQTSRKESDILYRLRIGQNTAAIYLYSSSPINRAALIPGMIFSGERDISDWLQSLCEGQCWRFDLLAAPMKKISFDGHKNSRRRILRNREERLEWLSRKSKQFGFVILDAEEMGSLHMAGGHPENQGGKMYWDAYRYEGVLQIKDCNLFCGAMTAGIGAGKAYGLGMLLLKR